MRKITEVLRLKFEAKLSHATIARALGLSKGAVNKYVSLAAIPGVYARDQAGPARTRVENGSA